MERLLRIRQNPWIWSELKRFYRDNPGIVHYRIKSLNLEYGLPLYILIRLFSKQVKRM